MEHNSSNSSLPINDLNQSSILSPSLDDPLEDEVPIAYAETEHEHPSSNDPSNSSLALGITTRSSAVSPQKAYST